MTTFWAIAGFMIAAAMLFIVPPLLGRGKGRASASRSELNLTVYRDQLRELETELAAGSLSKEQYQSARSELEGRVLEDSAATDDVIEAPSSGRWFAVAAMIAMPILTVSLYLMLGKPAELDAQHKTAGANPSQEVTQEQIIAMVDSLAKKLKEKPDDAEGWVMLGRSYLTLRRYDEAGAAYARAAALMPGNAQLLADYADVLAMNNGRSMQGEPEKIIRQALQADPNNIKALALAGTAAFQRKDYQGAVQWWQEVIKRVPPDSPIARSLNANISQAQGLSGQSLSPPQAATGQAQGQPGMVSGNVSLDPTLKGRVADTDTVFIFAKDADVQRRPPLAILRKTVKDLPMAFTLDDSMALMPNAKLSSAASLLVGARISKSGNAAPSPGDVEGYSKPVKIGEKNIGIKIDSVVN